MSFKTFIIFAVGKTISLWTETCLLDANTPVGTPPSDALAPLLSAHIPFTEFRPDVPSLDRLFLDLLETPFAPPSAPPPLPRPPPLPPSHSSHKSHESHLTHESHPAQNP